MLVTQSCLTLCNPMDCSLPGSSVHGILQARILEKGAIPFSRGSSTPMKRTQVSCTAGKFFSIWATRKLLSSKLIMCKMFPVTSIFENIQQETIMHRFKKEYLAKGTPYKINYIILPIFWFNLSFNSSKSISNPNSNSQINLSVANLFQ